MKDAAEEINALARALVKHLASLGIASEPVFIAIHLPMTAGPNGPPRSSFADAFADMGRMSGPASVMFMLPGINPSVVSKWSAKDRAKLDALSKAFAEKIELATSSGGTA